VGWPKVNTGGRRPPRGVTGGLHECIAILLRHGQPFQELRIKRLPHHGLARDIVSPTIVFGNANLADVDTEQKVVDSVGSYGYQLNRVLDALAVLIRESQDPTS
jgi:hypothetical protein